MSNIGKEIEILNKLSRHEICVLWRFAPTGHVYFRDNPLGDAFEQRFKELGGFSPEISKSIGWEDNGQFKIVEDKIKNLINE